MVRPPANNAGSAILEGCVLGALMGVLPFPLTFVPPIAFLLLAAMRCVERELVAVPLSLAAGLAVTMAIAALPLKPVDQRLALEANPTVGEVLEALEAAPRLHVKASARVDRSARLALATQPQARAAVAALQAAGLPALSLAGCLSGATLLRGPDGVLVALR